MRRPTPHGTPSRASRYVIPADTRRLVWRSLAVAAVLLVAFGGLFAAGFHRVASPGTLASAHGAIDVQCSHTWWLQNGKAVRFQQMVDTARVARAMS